MIPFCRLLDDFKNGSTENNPRVFHLGRLISNSIWKDLGYETPCLVWQGGHSGEGRGGGYGRISYYGCMYATHRLMWALFYGPIPHKKQIDHKCSNRLCINPYHLQMVTHKKNQRLRAQRNDNI